MILAVGGIFRSVIGTHEPHAEPDNWTPTEPIIGHPQSHSGDLVGVQMILAVGGILRSVIGHPRPSRRKLRGCPNDLRPRLGGCPNGWHHNQHRQAELFGEIGVERVGSDGRIKATCALDEQKIR